MVCLLSVARTVNIVLKHKVKLSSRSICDHTFSLLPLVLERIRMFIPGIAAYNLAILIYKMVRSVSTKLSLQLARAILHIPRCEDCSATHKVGHNGTCTLTTLFLVWRIFQMASPSTSSRLVRCDFASKRHGPDRFYRQWGRIEARSARNCCNGEAQNFWQYSHSTYSPEF